MSPERLPVHPYAELFPLMQHPDFDALCGHIAANGLQEEIVLYEGQILDGRNRYLACLAGGVAPRLEAGAQVLERLAPSAVGVYLDAPGVQEHLKQAIHKVLTAEPAHVCPACQGQQPACTLCRGHGWVTALIYKDATCLTSAAPAA